MLMLYPVGLLSFLVHELGHDTVSFLQGGTVTGITVTPNGGFADATATSLMFVGGWLGQYSLALLALLLYKLLKPASLLAGAATLWTVAWNLLNPPIYMATLTGDASGLFTDLSGTFGVGGAVAAIEGLAAGLVIAGLFVTWKLGRDIFGRMFEWAGEKGVGEAAAVVSAFTLVTIASGFFPVGVLALPVAGDLIGLSALVTTFLCIPPVASPYREAVRARRALTALLVALLLYALQEAFWLYVVPVNIPL